jgi:uncharacterized RDD family membrane protein YckC
MICAHCGNQELDSAGICLVCGLETPAAKPTEFHQKVGAGTFSGMIEMDFTGPSEAPAGAKEELPEWRKQLTQRLLEIKQKRELTTEQSDPHTESPDMSSPEGMTTAPSPQIRQVSATKHPRRPPRPGVVDPGAESTQRDSDQPQSLAKQSALPLFLAPAIVQPKAGEPQKEPSSSPAEHSLSPIKNLIDNAIIDGGAKIGSTAKVLEARGDFASSREKLILLSRTLAGLVDWVIVFLCTSAFILAADVFSGIDVIDAVSLISYAVLFLATYFVYSIFFLVTTNQTIGMMITELRLAALDGRRPPASHILARVAAYLPACLGLGLGLIWGCFDRENRCLHDRLSATRVVRIE